MPRFGLVTGRKACEVLEDTKVAFWKRTTSISIDPGPPPPPKRYVCNNDLCNLSLVGEVAAKLAYGCYLCTTPTRYEDLPKDIKWQIPLDNLSLLWRKHVRCPEHHGDMRPFCPEDFYRIDQDGNIPPVGIYGFSSAGKTVFCAALMVELEKLFNMTGILQDRLFDQGEYIKQVVAPLQTRGIVPEKTFGHRSLSLKLYKNGWFRKKVTLNDMGGENFEEWFSAKPTDDHRRKMLEHLLHVEDAIFLMSPESAQGLGATVPQDLYLVVRRALVLLKEGGYLLQDNHDRMEERLKKVQEIVSKFAYFFSGSGESLRPVAEEIAAMVCGEDCEELVDLLDRELTNIDEQLKVRSLNDQLGGLVGFLDAWSSRNENNNKLNQRLAITIGKTDLIQNILRGELNPSGSSAAQKSLGEWQVSIDRLHRMRPTDSKNDWQKALKRTSTAVRQVLIDFGEEQFVRYAEENFREVGFFLISSLGRDTEPFLDWGRKVSQQPSGEMMSAIGGQTVIKASTKATPQWDLGKRVRIGQAGHRRPEPQNVLWPLLWMLTAN